MDILLRCEDRV